MLGHPSPLINTIYLDHTWDHTHQACLKSGVFDTGISKMYSQARGQLVTLWLKHLESQHWVVTILRFRHQTRKITLQCLPAKLGGFQGSCDMARFPERLCNQMTPLTTGKGGQQKKIRRQTRQMLTHRVETLVPLVVGLGSACCDSTAILWKLIFFSPCIFLDGKKIRL